jgi:hypothetical protein
MTISDDFLEDNKGHRIADRSERTVEVTLLPVEIKALVNWHSEREAECARKRKYSEAKDHAERQDQLLGLLP